MKEDIFGMNYRNLSEHESAQMFDAREKAMEFAEIINALPDSREKELAMARLEEALMWTSKHIALRGV